MESLNRVRRDLLRIAAKLSWLPPALTRRTIGVIFLGTGWGKLHNLQKVTEFFVQLHIPAPGFNAALVATTELVCGALILLGLIARLAAIPLIITMCVAIATAKGGDIEGLRDLLGLQEFDYIVLLVWIAIAGAGALSLDRLFSRRPERRQSSGAAASAGHRA
jgi:putative oxidoreductase